MIPWNRKPPLGARLDRNNPLSRGLVGYWLMNENGGNLARDIASNNHDTITGATWGAGKFGPCLSFNGSGDTVSFGRIPQIELALASFSAWFRVNNLTEDHYLIGKGGLGASSPLVIWFDDVVSAGADVGAGNTNAIAVISSDGATTHRIATPTNAIADTGWHHVCVVVTPPLLAIYLDGRLSVSNSKAWNGIDDTSSSISASIADASCLSGELDNIAIYNRALTAGEIAQLYHNPFGMLRGRKRVFGWEPPTGEGAVVRINIGNSWKDYSSMKINISDSWRDVVSVKQNVGDSWRSVF